MRKVWLIVLLGLWGCAPPTYAFTLDLKYAPVIPSSGPNGANTFYCYATSDDSKTTWDCAGLKSTNALDSILNAQTLNQDPADYCYGGTFSVVSYGAIWMYSNTGIGVISPYIFGVFLKVHEDSEFVNNYPNDPGCTLPNAPGWDVAYPNLDAVWTLGELDTRVSGATLLCPLSSLGSQYNPGPLSTLNIVGETWSQYVCPCPQVNGQKTEWVGDIFDQTPGSDSCTGTLPVPSSPPFMTGWEAIVPTSLMF